MTRLISAEVMEMTPQKLKQLEKQVLSRIKIELDILKLSPLTKQQKQANEEYHIELENKMYNELSEEDCLKLIKKLTLNASRRSIEPPAPGRASSSSSSSASRSDTSRPSSSKQQYKHRRIVELDTLQITLKLFQHDYGDKNDFYIKKLLVILSHYPLWNSCECK